MSKWDPVWVFYLVEQLALHLAALLEIMMVLSSDLLLESQLAHVLVTSKEMLWESRMESMLETQKDMQMELEKA